MPNEYDDFEIEVSPCCCGQLEVRVLGSSFDRPRRTFVPPFELDELNQRLNELDSLMLYRSGTKEARLCEAQAKDMGARLFKALFPSPVSTTFEKSRAAMQAARDEGREKGLRIRVSFGVSNSYLPKVINLPWELLWNSSTGDFPASEPPATIVRYLDLPNKIKPLEVAPPLRVLAILSSPNSSGTEELPVIDLPKQRRILKAAEGDQGKLKVTFLETPNLRSIRPTLEKHKSLGRPFHAVHFFGHGEFDGNGEGVLYFEGRDKRPEKVKGADFAKQLAGFDDIRLSVLATCVGARMMREKGQHPFAGAASALIKRMPAVVAMQFTTSEEAATAFASRFYEYVAKGYPVDESVAEGRLAIAGADSGSQEWASPVLFMRTPDGVILDIKPEEELQVRQISIYNIMDLAKKNIEVNDRDIDLRGYFVQPDDKAGVRRAHIRHREDWNSGVLRDLARVLNRDLVQEATYRMTIAAPISIAFAAGFLLHTRNKGQLIFPQGGQFGSTEWIFEGDPGLHAQKWLPIETTANEVPSTIPIDKTSDDVAVVVELSRPILRSVEAYLQTDGAPKVGRVIYVRLEEGPGLGQVTNGAHAFSLAEGASNSVYGRVGGNPNTTVHWFIAGPNTFNFALGRHCRVFPKSQLYEFDFAAQGDGTGTYSPSILLPPTQG